MMMSRWAWAAGFVAALAACGPRGEAPAGEEAPVGGEAPAEQTSAAPGAVATVCEPTATGEELAGRASPYDSVTVTVGGEEAKICYSRPSARGREIFGGLVPYDTLWRTGANEPTIIHLPVAAEIAGIAVEPGSYSLYTVPGENEWTVIVNASTEQWGIESQYTEEIRAEEVGRATVPSEQTESFVEQFTIRSEPAAEGAELIMEWENTRVRVPITPGAA